MDTQQKKSEVIRRIREGKAQIDALVAATSAEKLVQPGANGEWSVKDLLAHMTFWHRNAIDNLQKGLQNIPPAWAEETPESGQSWTDETNDRVYQENKDRPLAEVRTDFDRATQDLLDLIQTVPDAEFAPGSKVEQTLGGSIEDIVASDTWQHYPQHIQQIRSWMERNA